VRYGDILPMRKKSNDIKQVRVPDDLHAEMVQIKKSCSFRTTLPALFEHATRCGLPATRKLFTPLLKSKPVATS
jgi:hypothetical protein